MIRYVVGFCFNEDGTKVALLKKTKPAWQAGKLNGLGGKIEEGESPLQAMGREFKEESGVGGLDWKARTVINNDHFSLTVFSCFDDRVFEVQTMEAEEVGIYCVGATGNTIDNLKWIIPMLLDRDLIINGFFSYPD